MRKPQVLFFKDFLGALDTKYLLFIYFLEDFFFALVFFFVTLRLVVAGFFLAFEAVFLFTRGIVVSL